MLVIKRKANEYVKSSGIVFVYTLMSSETTDAKIKKDLEDYKASQGEYYREDEKTSEPLYFSSRICNPGDELAMTKRGRYQVLRDLEDQATQIEKATTDKLGSYNALQQFTGLSKAQLAQRLIAAMA